MRPSLFILVAFAVKAEARPFEKLLCGHGEIQTLLTGIGARNAERAIKAAVERRRPDLVLTCGFAGGLRPGLATGTVLFSAEGERELEPLLLAAGARAGRFHMVDRIATTAEEKRLLWGKTGAEAVEMESGRLCAVCREQQIPCATVRVILDTSEEDLPLDFNQLMTDSQELAFGKLALAVVRAPGKVAALRRLQQQSESAAVRLGQVLASVIKSIHRAV